MFYVRDKKVCFVLGIVLGMDFLAIKKPVQNTG